jgi:hypothetical protein
MKLAVGYVVFDSLETLEYSLKSIRPNADIVIVSYQLISWRGLPASNELLPTLQKLKSIGLIDHLIEFKEFEPSYLRSPGEVMMAKQFELRKRQGCLDLARSLGATHYTSMDADEFYRGSELAWAKKEIEENSLDATAVRYINYVTPTLNRGYSRWRVPFIYKITPTCKHYGGQKLFSGVDPTRGLFDESYSKIRIFEQDKITMHHMEMVRKDLYSKYHNASRFFERRQNLREVERDIKESLETGVLRFKGQHLGDSDNPREEYPLFPCENEFNIDF